MRDRYYQDNETTPQQMIRRVADYVASGEKQYGWTDEQVKQLADDYFGTMNKRYWIPSSPFLMNAGTKVPMLSACFVVGGIEDDLEAIYESVKRQGIINKAGGGTGFNFSQLREEGSKIKSTGGTSSGVLSFMELYNTNGEIIKQGGRRRSANMAVLNYNHPEIMKYISYKNDHSKLTNFNISVLVDDKFMSKVEGNQEYDLISPVNNEVVGRLKAREVFMTIVENNWRSGEPGLLFRENINKDNPMQDYLGDIVTTNPCFTGDMRILTSDGYKRFDELHGKKGALIQNGNGDMVPSYIGKTGKKDVVAIRFLNKDPIKCTPGHIFMTNDGDNVRAQDLQGRRLMPNLNAKQRPSKQHRKFIKYGFIQGDGNLGRLDSSAHRGLEVCIGENDKDMLDLFQNYKWHNDYTIYTEKDNDLYELGFDSACLPERVLPNTYAQWAQDEKASFLMGCYSANGCVVTGHRVSYKTTSKTFAKQLIGALKDFGISAYITTNKPTSVMFSNGEYLCKESYDINIAQYESIENFYRYIGFYQEYKKQALRDLLVQLSPVVSKVACIGEEDVYSFSEPITNWGVVEGVIVHNCGEITLYDDEACNLASINLEEFVDWQGKVDWKELKHVVHLIIRFLDTGIDVNMFPDDIIEKKVKSLRRLGLGVMSLHGALIKAGFKYSSPEGRRFAEVLMEFIEDEAWKASHELALEKGAFSLWEHSTLKKKYRNVAVTCIAPTGTTQMILDTSSSGCEPIYSIAYIRRQTLKDDTIQEAKWVNPFFEEYAKYHGFWSDDLIRLINDNNGSLKNIGSIPLKHRELFEVASEIHPLDHVRMQAALQEWVSNSISKTINAPNDATVEDTYDAFMLGWKLGVKGLCYYRDGSRFGQVLSTSSTEAEAKTETEQEQISALQRGQWASPALDTKYYKRKIYIGCGKLNLFIGWSEDQQLIQDLYVVKSGSGGCTMNLQGMVIAMSGMLRLGGNLFNIEKAFEGVGVCPSFVLQRAKGMTLSSGSSCGAAILNEIKAFLTDVNNKEKRHNESGTNKIKNVSLKDISIDELLIEVIGEDGSKCPECGSELRAESGCFTCTCGFSHCG